MTPAPRTARWFALGFLALAVVLRLAVLDADPEYYGWSGYIVDEGRWLETARSLALGEPFDVFEKNVHLALAPLYQAVHYPVLALLGQTIWASRLLTALAGCALVLLAWTILRPRVRPDAALIGIALVATQADLVMLSRVAVPEIPAMLFELLVYSLITSRVESRRALGAAGVLTLLGIAVKATMLPMAGVFALVVLAVPRASEEAGRIGRRAVDALTYLAPLGATALAAAGIAFASGLVETDGLRWLVGVLRERTVLSSPLDLFGYPVWSVLAPSLALVSLGAWFAAIAWLTMPAERLGFAFRRNVAALATWSVAYYVLMVLIDYYPHRYDVHLLVPLMLLAAFAADVLVRNGLAPVARGLEGLRGATRLAAFGLLALPSGIIGAPLLLAAVRGTGGDVGRLRLQLGAIAIATAALAALAALRRSGTLVRVGLLTMPPVFAVAWHALALVNGWPGFWEAAGSVAGIGAWGIALVIAGGLGGAVTLAALRGGRTSSPAARRGALVAAAAVVLAAVSVAGYAGGLLSPTYTIRDTSRALGRSLEGAESIASFSTEGLFNENRLRYASEYRIDVEQAHPEYIVSTRPYTMYGMLRRMLKKRYELIEEHQLAIPATFARSSIHDREIVEAIFFVTVHRRLPDADVDESHASP